MRCNSPEWTLLVLTKKKKGSASINNCYSVWFEDNSSDKLDSLNMS